MSFGDLNIFTGIGRLTRDPEQRFTPSGKENCRLSIALNRSYKNQSGDIIENVSFLNITVWGNQAKSCSQYLKKGRRIAVSGELRSNNWTDKKGNKRTSWEISANEIHFLDSKKEEYEEMPE